MRDSVFNRVDEILRTVNTKAEVTIGKGLETSLEIKSESTGGPEEMVSESEIIGSEKPDDKEIPIITQEMMKKTEEEITKRREEQGI